MKDVRVIEVKKSVFESNDERAALLRKDLKDKGVFLLNLMSSPGASLSRKLSAEMISRSSNGRRIWRDSALTISEC